MKRIAIVAVFAAVAAVTMAARPISELQLFTQLNGQPVRWRMPDGGQSGIFTVYDAGAANAMACALLSDAVQWTGATLADGGRATTALTPNVLMLMPEVPVNICVRPQVDASGKALPWDGGCNGSTSDINAGVPWQPWVPFFTVPGERATHLCAFSDAGYLRAELNQMQ
jgi:hypothetical protein